MIRTFDIIISIILFLIGIPVFIAVFIFGIFDTGSPLYFQQRVGKNKQPFTMVKFRTMKLSTESVATHLVDAASVTTLGKFLRKTKLDELPQLWNVVKGDMSLVGPRPCLLNQHDLILEREALGVFKVRPGITGLAQVNGIDMSTPKLLAKTDKQLIINLNAKNYFKYLLKTITGCGFGDALKQQ